jgi:hypothetical protein
MYSAGIPLRVGFPIRTSADQRSLASPRGFSQRATSFIASWRQGIHRTPFSRSRISHHRPRAGPNRPMLPSLDGSARTSPRRGLAAPVMCSITHTPDHHTCERTARPSTDPAPLEADNRRQSGFRKNIAAPSRQRPGTVPARKHRGGMPETQCVADLSLRRIFPSAIRPWRLVGFEPRPPACKAGALPLSYAPAGDFHANSSTRSARRKTHRQRDAAPRRSASRVASLSLRGTMFSQRQRKHGGPGRT